MPNLFRALEPQPSPPTGAGVRAYGLAVLAAAAGVAVTRLTWPLFAGTPFVPVFGAIVATTHWGTWPAGLAAIALSVIGALLAFPTGGSSGWEPRTLIIFIPVALIGSRIIAGRNRTAAALRGSEGQLRATWEHATLGSALLDRAGRIQRMNPALERLLGRQGTAAADGTPFSTFVHPNEAEGEQRRLSELIEGTGAFYQSELRYLRQDGSVFWGRSTVSVIRGSNGVATGALAVLEDVTAQRQAAIDLRASEEKLRRVQKVEAVAQLVAGVAHNFNNLLTVTMGYTDILLEDRQDDDLNRNAVQEIRRASERGAALTRQLLAFGRKHDARVTRIDLDRTVERLREMLGGVIREDTQLTIHAGPGPAAVMIDPHDFEQVLLNLVINARDALPAGGSISIDVQRQPLEPSEMPPDVAVAPGEFVRVRVRDDGVGMTPEVQSHLFEPFFTTKGVGEGTGLGLAFVHGIAQHAGGFVTVDTSPGKGTSVSVWLPPAPEASTPFAFAPERPTVASSVPAPGATVLLVEDEDGVRSMTERMLSRAGYRVLSAATPGEACALFERHADDIDLLMTDVVMPEMHGPVLAERLVARRPDLRVLFVSGYSDAPPAGAAAAGSVFLGKPFSSARLAATVARLLAEPGS